MSRTPNPIDTAVQEDELHVLLQCVVLGAIIFAIDLLMPLGVSGGVPYILPVMISLRSSRRPLPYYVATAATTLVVAGFVASPPAGDIWKAVLNRSLAVLAIWTTAALGRQLVSYRHQREAALTRLHHLRGLLPICTSCKSIRDDQGYWTELESYISEHSDADFSHSICPDCARELYPDVSMQGNQGR